MTTLSQFIAEIETRLKNYTKDIDKVSIKTDVLNELRKFGNNICELKEAVVNVRNTSAELPEDFKSLRLALKVEPIGCKVFGDKKNITDSYIYRERIENPAYFDEINQEYVTTCNPKIITEKITINNTDAEFYYTPQWLSLKKGISKTSLSAECVNLHPSVRNRYPHEISITNRFLNANFSQGEVYIQYYGFPTTDDGELIIPTFTTNEIYDYLEAYIKSRIAEDIIANNLNPNAGLISLYEKWSASLLPLKKGALREAKFHGLGDYQKTLKTQNKRISQQFIVPYLNFR